MGKKSNNGDKMTTLGGNELLGGGLRSPSAFLVLTCRVCVSPDVSAASAVCGEPNIRTVWDAETKVKPSIHLYYYMI